MSKTESLEFKGMAILMMLWLHLFSMQDVVGLYGIADLSFFNGKPLCVVLTRLCSCCVPLYIFLGGYGLTQVYTSRGTGHVGRRALALMTELWLVCLVVVPIGAVLEPEEYPVSAEVLLGNVLGIHCSYNGTWWFMLPYAMVTLVSPWLVRQFYRGSRRTVWWLLAACLSLKLAEHLTADKFDTSPHLMVNLIGVLLHAAGMGLMFGVGVLFARGRLFQASERWLGGVRHRSLAFLGLLCMLLLAKMLMGRSGLLNLPYVPLFLLLTHNIRLGAWLSGAFAFLGRQSSMMWLWHAFFIQMPFGLTVYRLHYPPLIFLALVGLSLAVALALTPVYRALRNRITHSPALLRP